MSELSDLIEREAAVLKLERRQQRAEWLRLERLKQAGWGRYDSAFWGGYVTGLRYAKRALRSLPDADRYDEIRERWDRFKGELKMDPDHRPASAYTDILVLLARIAELEGRRCETCKHWQDGECRGGGVTTDRYAELEKAARDLASAYTALQKSYWTDSNLEALISNTKTALAALIAAIATLDEESEPHE